MKKTLPAPQPPQQDWPEPVEAPIAPVLTPAESRRAWLLSLLATGIILFLGWVLGRWAPPALIGPWATGIATVLFGLTGGGLLLYCADSWAVVVTRIIAAFSLVVLGANFLSALGLLS